MFEDCLLTIPSGDDGTMPLAGRELGDIAIGIDAMPLDGRVDDGEAVRLNEALALACAKAWADGPFFVPEGFAIFGLAGFIAFGAVERSGRPIFDLNFTFIGSPFGCEVGVSPADSLRGRLDPGGDR